MHRIHKNPPSQGFAQIGSGSFTTAYSKDNIVEAIVCSDSYSDYMVDCSKDILIEARKLCDENSKQYLPEIKRKLIYNYGECYEFVYEMPKYNVRKYFDYTEDNVLAEKLSAFLYSYNIHLSPKTTNADRIVLELVNNVWKNCNKIDVSSACNAILAIEKAWENITPNELGWDLKAQNMAMNVIDNQMIFLDPIFCEIKAKDLLKIWKKNGITP